MKKLGMVIVKGIEYNVFHVDSFDYMFSDDENTIILMDSIVSCDGTQEEAVKGALGIMHTAGSETYEFTMYDFVNLDGLDAWLNNGADFAEPSFHRVEEEAMCITL